MLYTSFFVGWAIDDYFSRTDGLQYAYNLMNFRKLVGMEYSECCDLLQESEEKYEEFHFIDEHKITGEYNGKSVSSRRRYLAGYANGASGREVPFILMVDFGTDDKVIYVEIFEGQV